MNPEQTRNDEEAFDINKKLEELPIEISLRAIDRLKVARLRHNKGLWAKILLIIALIGPGILVMVADNDAGGVITYAQTGSIFGLGFFIPLMILMVMVGLHAIQEHEPQGAFDIRVLSWNINFR